MKYCPACGRQSEDNAVFCSNCGYPFPDEKAAEDPQSNASAEEAAEPAVVIQADQTEYSEQGSQFTADARLVHNETAENSPEKKKPKKKLITPIIIVITCIIILISLLTAGGILLAVYFGGDINPSWSFGSSDSEDSTTTSTEEVTTDFDPQFSSIEKGILSGNIYTNESADITFTPGKGWKICSDEQIAEILQIGLDSLNAENFSATLLNQISTVDLMANDASTNSSVSISFENLVLTGNRNITTKEFYEAMKKQLITVSGSDVSEITDLAYTKIGDNDYAVFDYVFVSNGVKLQMRTFLRKIDTHMVSISISTETGSINEIADMLS